MRDGANALIASYYYDPFGKRIWKDVNGVRTYFAYSDEGLVAELDGSGVVSRSYGYPPDIEYSAEPLFISVNNEYYYLQLDQLRTPVKIITKNGNIVWDARRQVYGETSIGISTLENNFRFPGQYFDAETDLQYNYNRFYDPTIGRYLTSDPLDIEAGLNTYLYADSNPATYTDPSGLIVPRPDILCRFLPCPDNPLPGEGLKPPGTCTPGKYYRLRNEVSYRCKNRSKPRKCNQEMSCWALRNRLYNAQMCLLARHRLMATCFKGGDARHWRPVRDSVKNVQNCYGALNSRECDDTTPLCD